MYWRDEWPKADDGGPWNGLDQFKLVLNGKSPFAGVCDIHLLIREIEENVGDQVADITLVNYGSNNYGFQMTLSNGQEIVARLARGDLNMPEFEGFPIESQIAEVKFEAAAYELLREHLELKTSRLLLSSCSSAVSG